jgi:hypothetical protein
MRESLHQTASSPLTRYLADAAATEAMGARLAPALSAGLVITLSGDLGTGKTNAGPRLPAGAWLDGSGEESDLYAS